MADEEVVRAPMQTNISEDIERIADNDPEMITFNHTNYSASMDEDQWEALADALAHNTTVEELLLENANVETTYMIAIAKALETNKTLKLVDVSSNRFGVDAFVAIANMLLVNDTLEIAKIDNQKVLPGPEAEKKLAAVFDVNTTMLDLRLKYKDLTCRTAATKGEVRNKQISKRKAAGQDWADLDPARMNEVAAEAAAKREAQRKAEEERKAPVKEKVESTGGPYLYKELTALIELQPDDAAGRKDKETYLGDDEFQELFGCGKDEFKAWPKWKKKSKKKELKLH